MSAKLGTGVTDLLDAVVARVPPPRSAGRDADLRLFLFDSWWDKYHGSINLVQVVDGVLSGSKNNVVVSSKTGKEYKVKELPMDILMDLTLEELRELDAKYAQCEIQNQKSESSP